MAISRTSDAHRILLLITDLQIGGTPTVVRELAIRLNDPPHVRVDVACLAGPGPVVDQLKAAGIQVMPLMAKGATDLLTIPYLFQLISSNRYDTVFSFLIHANAAAAMVAPFCTGVRFLQSIQTTQPTPRWHWRLQSLVQHAAVRIVVPSPSVADAAMAWANVPREKITVISNAIDLDDFPRSGLADPVGSAPRTTTSSALEGVSGTGYQPVKSLENHGLVARATEIQENPLTIGFIGRLDPIKRIPDLLHAMTFLSPEIHLNIFGEGRERSHIESLIRQLNLSDRVKLRGSVARPQEALAGISLLVLPSAAEGFGLVLIEAMAARIPVVATDVPGIKDVIRNGETGLLVPSNSPNELAKAIDRVVRDLRFREKLISQALENIELRFTWEVVMPQYRDLLGL
jgi:glycosyltransferase involved in cell wall biosynthesis